MKQTTHDAALEFYRSFLASINVTEGDNGELLHHISNRVDPKPILIKDKVDGVSIDKPLVMPTKENLRRLSIDGLIGFNPICESSVRGESEVFRKLKRLVVFKVSQSMLILMQVLVRLAMAEDSTKRLNSKQMEFLALAMGDDLPKEKFASKLTKAIASASTEKSQVLPVTIYVKRDAKQVGVSDPFRRAAIVSFPFALEAARKPDQLAGVTFAVYEMRIINSMLNAILPGLTEQDTYSYYGNPAVVPNFTSLLNAWYTIASKLNEAMVLFDEEDPDIQKIDLSWYGKMNSLSSWIGVIQPLAGNEGDGEDNTERMIRDNAKVERPEARQPQRERVPERNLPQRESFRQSSPSASSATTDGVERVKIGSTSRDRDYGRDRGREVYRNERHSHAPRREPYRQTRNSGLQYADDGVDTGRDLSRELSRLSRGGRDDYSQQRPYDPYGAQERYRDSVDAPEDRRYHRGRPTRTNF